MGKVGRFGIFGGQYVPETVMNAVHELEAAYAKYGNDPEFLEEYRTLLRTMPADRRCCTTQTG